MKNIHLVRDYLDQQLVDAKGRKMGRIDGITIEVRQRKPPIVRSLDVGSSVLFERVSSHLSRLLRACGRLIGAEPLHIDPKHIVHGGIDMKLDIDAVECGALAWEAWLREKVVCRLPGSN